MRQRRTRLARATATTAVAACTLAGAAYAVKPATSHTFQGPTGQTGLKNHTITLKTGDRAKVKHARIHWRAHCDTGKFWIETTDVNRPAIVNEAGGAFHADVA